MEIKKHFGHDVMIQDGIEEIPFVTNDDIKKHFKSKIILRKWTRKSTTPVDEKTFVLKRVPYVDNYVNMVYVDWTNYPIKEGNVKRSRALEIINRDIDSIISKGSLNKLDVIVQDVFNKTERVKTYHVINKNHKHKMWIKHLKMGKPSKMESKKMYHKKSLEKKSSVKRMTGNIEALGKNFNKLI